MKLIEEEFIDLNHIKHHLETYLNTYAPFYPDVPFIVSYVIPRVLKYYYSSLFPFLVYNASFTWIIDEKHDDPPHLKWEVNLQWKYGEV